jgi:hypothetical protein
MYRLQRYHSGQQFGYTGVGWCFPESPYFINSPVGSTIQLLYIQTAALSDIFAVGTFITGIIIQGIFTTENFGKDPGGGCFSYPPGARKKIAVGHPIHANSILESPGYMKLPHYFIKALWPPFSG